MPEDSQHSERSRRKRDRSPLRRATKIIEWVGGGLLCLLVAATPWLFGTTEDWSVRVMNLGSYAAGAIMAIAAILNRFARREDPFPRSRREHLFSRIFLVLNLSVLAFCVVAFWNARATFSVFDQSFEYRDNVIPSLPTSYDANLTRETFITLLACCIVFWSIRSWIFNGARQRSENSSESMLRNKRFQLLVWIVSLNGMAIAIQGILQRLSNSSKLLWMRESWWKSAIACFGPFSYRGNAAEYLNLIWPLALGFWWVLSRDRSRRQGSSRVFTDGPELLLIPAMVVMVTACIISLSRGGAIITAGCLISIGTIFLIQKGTSLRARMGVLGFVVLVVGMVWLLGWNVLVIRFRSDGLSSMSGRQEIYRNAKQMAADYPVYGIGPGTFRSVYHLYRQETTELWHGFLHDDWMETRVTFGWVGFALTVANLLWLAAWCALPGKPAVFYAFSACAGIGLAGALVHAKFDFPFQTYSIFYTFVVIAAILSSVSPARR
jgi:O-antigen ligase